MRSVKHGGKKTMRYRFKLSSVKRQNKKGKKKQKQITGSEAIDKAWDKKMTTRQNLASMGLAYDPNEMRLAEEIMEVDEIDLNQVKAIGSLNEQRKQRKKQRSSIKGGQILKDPTKKNVGKTTKILKELEQIAIMESNEVEEQKKCRRPKANLHQNDIEFCEKMVAKHGDNYDAMSRDPLNTWQNTSKQIERKIAIYKRNKQ